jgi:hypothetical protein
MHAAVLHALGKPPLFEEFPDPTPGEGEALVHVCAAALKSVDKQLAGGKHYASPREFPVVCGADGGGAARGRNANVLWWATATVRCLSHCFRIARHSGQSPRSQEWPRIRYARYVLLFPNRAPASLGS